MAKLISSKNGPWQELQNEITKISLSPGLKQCSSGVQDIVLPNSGGKSLYSMTPFMCPKRKEHHDNFIN